MENKTLIIDTSLLTWLISYKYNNYYFLSSDNTLSLIALTSIFRRVNEIRKITSAKNVVFVRDSPPYKRLELITTLKQNRVKDDKTKSLVNTISNLFNYLPTLKVTGMEADDLIGFLVHKKPNNDFIILSNDSDLYQLLGVNPYLSFCTNSTKIDSLNDIRKKFNVEHLEGEALINYFVDINCLNGHNNLPKVINRCGKVTAHKLCQNGGLDDSLLTEEQLVIMNLNREAVKLPLKGFGNSIEEGVSKYNDLLENFKPSKVLSFFESTSSLPSITTEDLRMFIRLFSIYNRV